MSQSPTRAISTISWSWAPHVMAIELKKALSYRAAFWIHFILGTATDLAVAYFLWRAIYDIRGEAVLQGYAFTELMYYYLFATFSLKISRGSDRGYLSQDIYDGGLTRYLIYPLPFIGFKFVTHLSQQILGIFQLLIAFIVLRLLLGPPDSGQLTFATLAVGVLTCILTGYLYFMIAGCLEMVAFWQDNVWNLTAMLRFSTALLGGAMIPLAFFPQIAQDVLFFTPFPSLVAFPTKTFLGQLTLNEWFASAGVLAVWSVIMTLVASFIWSKGTKQYSGVGI